MLPPDSRQLFHDLLAPPCGWSLDGAMGTTYSLDLESLIMVPLAFMRQAGRWEENETPDPVALLAALRRHAGQLTVFCQAGQVALSGSFPRLSQLMEPCVHEVLAPHREGVFHPKVWILRFVFRGDDEEEEERKAGQVRYRVLVMSRNLTMDRSWDLAVALEGDYRDDRQRAYAQNHPLADFVKALPSLACRDLPEHRRQSVERMAEELRRVEFEMPDEFEPGEFLFQPTGFDPAQTPVNPLDYQIDRMLAVSPFLNESWLREAQQSCNEIHLISRQESLDALSLDCLQKCASLHTLHRQASVGEEDVDDLLQGLHAKCLVMDAGWNTHWRLGSHNATTSAWHRNVEFSVGFTAKRSTHGVEKILSASKKSAGEMLFADLLTPYLLESRSAAIEEDEAWKRQCLKTRRAIAEAHFYWDVSEREDGQFSCRLDCESEPDGLHEFGALAVRPMSVSEAWQRRVLPAGAAEFPNL
ncbi:MAG: phospholipase D family protein, partial [Verrucomicrobiales bacterium]|nr:phospholipase D family protein [Verrucomicrobiales bacterium]